jgi:hypothetical protein
MKRLSNYRFRVVRKLFNDFLIVEAVVAGSHVCPLVRGSCSTRGETYRAPTSSRASGNRDDQARFRTHAVDPDNHEALPAQEVLIDGPRPGNRCGLPWPVSTGGLSPPPDRRDEGRYGVPKKSRYNGVSMSPIWGLDRDVPFLGVPALHRDGKYKTCWANMSGTVQWRAGPRLPWLEAPATIPTRRLILPIMACFRVLLGRAPRPASRCEQGRLLAIPKAAVRRVVPCIV